MDKDLISKFQCKLDRYAYNLSHCCQAENRSSMARRYNIMGISMANRVFLVTGKVAGETPFVNSLRKLLHLLPNSYNTPKMFSRLIFRLSGFTMTVFIKLDKGVMKMNMAGPVLCESVLYGSFLFGWLMGNLSLLFSDHRLKPMEQKITNLSLRMVNNVIVIHLSRNHLAVEKLRTNPLDIFKRYEPNEFPGAFFVCSPDLNDCSSLRVFDTSKINFLKVLHLQHFCSCLPTRLEYYFKFVGGPLQKNPKLRQVKRLSMTRVTKMKPKLSIPSREKTLKKSNK